MSAIDRILFLWKHSFYTEPLFQVFDCIAIYIIYRSKKSIPRILFSVYAISALLLFIITDIMFVTRGYENFHIWEILNIISLIEFSIFYTFYGGLLRNKRLKRITSFLNIYIIPFFILTAILILSSDRTYVFIWGGYFSSIIYILLMIPPLLYFHQSLKDNQELEKKTALMNVWLFCYCIITILPTIIEGWFLYTQYTKIYRLVISLHYIMLTVLCYLLVLIVKASDLKIKKRGLALN